MPTSALARSLGSMLQQHREASGVSRKALADRNHLAANTLREVELGQANPTLARIEELGAIYGLGIAIVPVDGPVAAVHPRPVARAQ